MNSKKFVAMV